MFPLIKLLMLNHKTPWKPLTHVPYTTKQAHGSLSVAVCLFVCFFTKSFLTYSFFHIHLLYQPYPGLCQAHMCSNCSHWSFTLTFTLTSENLALCTTLLLLLVLDSNYCCTRCIQLPLAFVLSLLLLHPRLLATFQSDIQLFTLTWPAKHSPNQGWKSTHRLHLYPLGGVFYSPQHRALGRRDLEFTSHPNDDGEPWERFSQSIPNNLAGVVFMNRVLNSGHPSKYWPCRMAA